MDRFNVSVSGRPGARLLLGVSTALLLCACSQDNSTSSISGVDAAEPELSDMQPADVASPTDVDEQDALPTGFRPADLPSDGPPNLAGADDLTNPVPAGAVRAGRVDQEQERLRGPEANCRVGDFRLDNSKVSVCIQAETTFSNFSFFGGNLIDAHLADRPGTDLLREIVIVPGGGEVTVEQIGISEDGSDGVAIIQTRGRAQGALILQGLSPGSFIPPDYQITTEYRLHPDSFTVEVWTWIHDDRRIGGRINLIDFVYFGDRNRDFKPGFAPDTMIKPMSYVAADGDQVSYRWSAGGTEFSAFTVALLFDDDKIPGTPIQFDRVEFGRDDMHLFKREFVIGHGDIEGVKPPEADAVTVTFSGTPRARIDIDTESLESTTRVQLDENGEGNAKLRPGPYVARTFKHAGGDITLPFTATQGERVILDMPPPGTLRIRITDGDGQPIAARVDLNGPARKTLYVIDDLTAEIPVGDWQFVAARGWHYNVAQGAFAVTAGETTSINVELTQVITLDGWASGEFHQHASPSLDSEVSVEDRVLSNVVEGVDFMIPSDHDFVYDYASLIERMGLRERISSPVTGEEVSPLFTHLGAYGIPHDQYAGAGGAVRLPIRDGDDWRAKTVPELIEEIRERGARTVQVNHARASQGYFDHVGYEPHVPIESLDHEEFSSDFESIEVFNSAGYFCRNLADWLGLLNQGLRVTAVGNSDTHSLNTPPGYPRNYIQTLAPNRVDISDDEIHSALEEGRLVIGGGAVLDFPEGPQPGETVQESADEIQIRVRIRTPSHLAVDRLMVFINGILTVDLPVESDAADIVDFDQPVMIPNDADGHVVFLAMGDERLQFIRPGQPIFALANPIWLDKEGDGIIPPGPGPIEPMQFPFCRR